MLNLFLFTPLAQTAVALVAIVPHFCILAMDRMAFKDVGAGIWSCIGYMAAGALGLALSMRPRVSRLQIGKYRAKPHLMVLLKMA